MGRQNKEQTTAVGKHKCGVELNPRKYDITYNEQIILYSIFTERMLHNRQRKSQHVEIIALKIYTKQ